MTTACRTGLLIALCLALLPALAYSAPPKPMGVLVYSDDFSDPAKSGLEDMPDAPDYGRGFHLPGVYILNLHKASDTRWTLFPNKSYGQFTLEMDLWDDSDSFQGTATQGVVFRAQDNTHLYAVLIDPRSGKYAVRKLNGSGAWSDLIAWKASPGIKRKSEVNQLRVDASGDSFTIYLNGEQLDTFKDGSYAKGGLGLLATNTDAVDPLMHFDNAKIYSTEGAPASLPQTGQARSEEGPLLAGLAFTLLVLGGWVLRQQRIKPTVR